jgi:hypothetical protein
MLAKRSSTARKVAKRKTSSSISAVEASAPKNVSKTADETRSAKTNIEKQMALERLKAELASQKREHELELELTRKEKTLRLEAEQQQLKYDLEAEQQKIKHALELEKLQKEQEFQLTCKRMELENSLRQCEITSQKDGTDAVQENTSNWMGNRFNLGLSKFSNQSMDLEAFLNRFELVATSYKLPKICGQ